jgi:pimeloyl-ACP methyl ester carboxylesterase
MSLRHVEEEIRPFHFRASDEALADLRSRMQAARFPEKELVADHWRRAEARLKALPQFSTEIDGVEIHFIHVKSQHENALPLIMTHGWPGSVVELLDAVGPLTDPTVHGGTSEDAFHLVLPSLPGSGFSGKPTALGWAGIRVGSHARGPN